MSQVIRKFSNGGKPTKLDDSQLFNREGYGNYKRADLADKLARDLDNYLLNSNLSEKDQIAFREFLPQAIQGVRDGSITNMDSKGIHNNLNLNSSGESEKKKFLGIKTNTNRSFNKSDKTNDNQNNKLNEFNKYFTYVINNSKIYDYDSELAQYEKEHPVKPWDYEQAVYDHALGGQKDLKKFYSLDYDAETNKYGTANRMKAIAETLNDRINQYSNDKELWFNNKSYKDADSYYGDMQKLSTDLLNGNYNKALAYKLGFDYDTMLGNTLPDEQNQFESEVEKQRKLQEILGIDQGATLNKDYESDDFDQYIFKDGSKKLYYKGTGREATGIIPSNVFSGTNAIKYVLNGDIYNEEDLPDNIKGNLVNMRKANLPNYLSIPDYDPRAIDLRNKYNYLTNISSFGQLPEGYQLLAAHQDPTNSQSPVNYVINTPKGEFIEGNIFYNDTAKQWQFNGKDNSVMNLGSYNAAGSVQTPTNIFTDYTDLNNDKLFDLYYNQQEELRNSASNLSKLFQKALSNLKQDKLPKNFAFKNNMYTWMGKDNRNIYITPNGLGGYNYNFDGNNIIWKKDGGVITKAQLGVKFGGSDNIDYLSKLPRQDLIDTPEKDRIRARQSNTTGRGDATLGEVFGSDNDLQNAGGVISDSEKWKLGAALVDLASSGLGFVPGANLASAGLGASASTASFIADLSNEGLTWRNAGNYLTNLGLDAISLIPSGKAFKITKNLGTVAKFVPIMLTAIDGMTLVASEKRNLQNTLKKVMDLDITKFNTQDLDNLKTISTILLGGKNLVKAHKTKLNSGTEYTGNKKISGTVGNDEISLTLPDGNLKGKNKEVIKSLRQKLANEYNTKNGLTGENAIKPEDVNIDTNILGRVSSSKVYNETENNWFTKNKVGKWLVGYKDPSIARGSEKIPFSDKWFYNKFNKTNTPSDTDIKVDKKLPVSTKSSEQNTAELKEWTKAHNNYYKNQALKDAELRAEILNNPNIDLGIKRGIVLYNPNTNQSDFDLEFYKSQANLKAVLQKLETAKKRGIVEAVPKNRRLTSTAGKNTMNINVNKKGGVLKYQGGNTIGTPGDTNEKYGIFNNLKNIQINQDKFLPIYRLFNTLVANKKAYEATKNIQPLILEKPNQAVINVTTDYDLSNKTNQANSSILSQAADSQYSDPRLREMTLNRAMEIVNNNNLTQAANQNNSLNHQRQILMQNQDNYNKLNTEITNKNLASVNQFNTNKAMQEAIYNTQKGKVINDYLLEKQYQKQTSEGAIKQIDYKIKYNNLYNDYLPKLIKARENIVNYMKNSNNLNNLNSDAEYNKLLQDYKDLENSYKQKQLDFQKDIYSTKPLISFNKEGDKLKKLQDKYDKEYLKNAEKQNKNFLKIVAMDNKDRQLKLNKLIKSLRQ